MVARFPAEISKLPLRLPAPSRRSTNDLAFQPALRAKSCRFRSLVPGRSEGYALCCANPFEFCSYGIPAIFLKTCTSNPFTIRSYRKCARKSFRMRSYKNTGGGGASAGPRHRLLPPSYAPRGASIPFGLSRLRILPVTTGVWGPPAFLATRLPRARVCEGPLATHHSPLPLCFHPLADSLSLFALFFRLPFFIFNSLQPPFAKTPGVGDISLALKRADAPSTSRSDFWTLGGSRRRLPGPELYLRDGTARPTFRASDRSYDQGREMRPMASCEPGQGLQPVPVLAMGDRRTGRNCGGPFRARNLPRTP